jgi:hypothetical protein
MTDLGPEKESARWAVMSLLAAGKGSADPDVKGTPEQPVPV